MARFRAEMSFLVRQRSSSNVMSNGQGKLFSIPRGRADRGGTGGQIRHLEKYLGTCLIITYMLVTTIKR